ncbi:YfhO family protein, partial [Streptococcus agalactiae]|nr:YfhO family protein [Streptococcus agalactiae]MCK6327149.1 YfhO family protein [Streptococcus agalactiae]
IYLLTICKIGLIGLSMFVTLCKRHCKVNRILLLVISTCYSLMSFSISQIEINMWLDVFILIPLVVLGVDQLLWERKPILYFLSLTALFIQNYYFGFMTAIFTSLYFIVQITRNTDSTVAFKQFLHFTFLSLLAGMTSSIMILPTYFDLTTHGEKLTKVSKMFTENSWYMDLFAKNMIGAYDTTKFGSIPMIYVGLLPLLLSLLYFT